MTEKNLADMTPEKRAAYVLEGPAYEEWVDPDRLAALRDADQAEGERIGERRGRIAELRRLCDRAGGGDSRERYMIAVVKARLAELEDKP